MIHEKRMRGPGGKKPAAALVREQEVYQFCGPAEPRLGFALIRRLLDSLRTCGESQGASRRRGVAWETRYRI